MKRVTIDFPAEDQSNVEILLSDDQYEMIEQAKGHLNLDWTWFVAGATEYMRIHDPERSDRIADRVVQETEDSYLTMPQKQDKAQKELLKTNLIDFAEYVVDHEPPKDYTKDSDGLELGGAFEQ